jgi:HEAT repeat protein
VTPARARGFAAAAFLVLAFSGLAPGAEDPNPPPADQRAEVERLIARLRGERWAEREEAMAALRALGREAFPALSALKPDDDADLAWRVQRLLQEIRVPAPAGQKQSLAELMAEYGRRPARDRPGLIQAAVLNGGPACIPWLAELLGAEEDPVVLAAVVSQLSWLPATPEAAKALKRFLAQRAAESLKGQALFALAGADRQEALPLVREALKGDAEDQRLWAVKSVQRLSDRESLPAVRALAKGGPGVGAELQAQALETVIGLLDEDAGPLCIEVLGSAEGDVAAAALRGIALLRPAGAAGKLAAMYGDAAAKDLRDGILAAMGALGDPSFVPLLTQCLKQTPPLRTAALAALQTMRAREAAPDAAACLNDPDRSVRMQAAATVAALGWKDAIPRLKQLVGDPEPEFALAAAKALTSLGDPAGPERIVSLLDRVSPRRVRGVPDLIGEYHLEAGLPRLKELAFSGDTEAVWALAEYGCDEDSFRRLLKPFVLRHLSAPRSPTQAIQLALFLAQHDLYAQAAKLLEDVAARVPNYAYAHSRLAHVYHELGRYAEGEAAFNRWELSGGTEAGYLNNRSWLYSTAFKAEYVKPETALALARRALAVEPGASHIVDTHGWALHVSKRYGEAVKEMTRSLEMRDPADRKGRAWEKTRIARSLYALGRKDEALSLTGQALEDAPWDPKTWFEAAGFYASSGRRDDAVHAAHMAVQQGFHHVEALKQNPEFDALRKDPGFGHAVRAAEQARGVYEKAWAEIEAEVRHALPATPAGTRPGDNGDEIQILEDWTIIE